MNAQRAPVSVVALNLDGVCIHDGCRPAMQIIAERWGASYDREIEMVLSSDSTVAFPTLARKLGIPGSEAELLKIFLEEREKCPGGPFDGLAGTLARLRRRDGLRILCYGASGDGYFRRKLGNLAGDFDDYVSIDGYRPGLHRIARDVCGVSFEEVVFVDDMTNVAHAAKAVGSPFIGVLSEFPWALDAQGMHEVGCEHVVASVGDVTLELLDSASRQGSA